MLTAFRFITALLSFCLLLLASTPATAQKAESSDGLTFTLLATLDVANGANPFYGPLAEGSDGNFYGTTRTGGANDKGEVFKMTPAGILTTLYSFCSQMNCADGAFPLAGLVHATDGNFYGTTTEGGSSNACTGGCGTIYKMTPSGTLTTLHSFDFSDGAHPAGTLVQGRDGNLYGTTESGGQDRLCGTEGCGTVFKVSLAGTLTTLHDFGQTDGEKPVAGLVLASNGFFYGTTTKGGGSGFCTNGCGTVYRITASGSFATLHRFDDEDGARPVGALVQAINGSLYGTTESGGIYGKGTVFRIIGGGKLIVLLSFNGSDGAKPYAGLIQANDRNLYGTTEAGGFSNRGTVFRISTTGNLTTIYNFCSLPFCADGAYPFARLFEASDGNLYGTTESGGTDNVGILFTVTIP